MDLERIIQNLIDRRETAGDAERRFIERILTRLRYSYKEAGRIIEENSALWYALPLQPVPSSGPVIYPPQWHKQSH